MLMLPPLLPRIIDVAARYCCALMSVPMPLPMLTPCHYYASAFHMLPAPLPLPQIIYEEVREGAACYIMRYFSCHEGRPPRPHVATRHAMLSLLLDAAADAALLLMLRASRHYTLPFFVIYVCHGAPWLLPYIRLRHYVAAYAFFIDAAPLLVERRCHELSCLRAAADAAR